METSPEKKAFLLSILEIRSFASEVLLLPDNDSYKNYVELEREFVVWNVIATPEFSMQPIQWCFLIVGCLPYRGYFAKADAMQYAETLRSRNYDVYTGGVTAYSTLGWFDDPVLSTMLRGGLTRVARIMFHELAHQQIYIPDDTEFNEAFADTVARFGVAKWLKSLGKEADLLAFEQQLNREQEFTRFIAEFRDRFALLYQEDIPITDKRSKKQALFTRMYADYLSLRSGRDGYNDFDSWFRNEQNNARLATILTYRDLEPGFTALYKTVDGNIERFYKMVTLLGECNEDERRKFLQQASGIPECR